MDYGYLNRPTCRGCDNGSRAFLYAACGGMAERGRRAVGLKEGVVGAARHRQAMILAALVTTFAGVALFIDRPHGTVLEWLVAPFLAFGAALFTWAVWPRPAALPGKRNDLASRLILRATFDGRLIPFFPSIGVGVMLGDLVYNLLFSATPALQAEDIMVLLGASFLVGYRLIPERFDRERDFVLFFCLLLNAILVVPLLLARVYYDGLAKSINLYSWVSLAPETRAFPSALDVSNTMHSDPVHSVPSFEFSHFPPAVHLYLIRKQAIEIPALSRLCFDSAEISESVNFCVMEAIKLGRLHTPIVFIAARINLSRFVLAGCAAKASATVTFP